MKLDEIKTKRTILRWFQEDDLDDMAKVLGHPDVMRFSLSGPYSREKTKKFIDGCLSQYEKNGVGLYAVVFQADRRVIGYCGYYFQTIDGKEEVEISYRLHPDYWNQGLATETSKAVQEHGFNKLGFNRMISIIESENIASIKVAEKNGMINEKDALFHNKVPVKIYSI
ncbi:MAG: GNAT family N-acetyltransferase [Planctomycetes bacterium]|nr:GNAT family N-acetyltransferase [Planctomycetota bacterium]